MEMAGEAATFSDILQLVGDAGRWQVIVFLWSSIGVTLTALHNLSSVFLGATPEHHCAIPGLNDSSTQHEDVLKQWIPWNNATDQWSQCRRYSQAGRLDDEVDCDAWVYSHDVYASTIVEQWDLVCHRTWLLSTVQSSYMLGSLFGALADGILSDHFGRKWTACISSLLLIVSSIGAAFSGSYLVFVLLRLVSAVGQAGIFGSMFVLCMEVVSPRWRALMGMIYELPFAFGFMLLAALAYFIRDWVQLQLVISLPALVLLLYWFTLPESPRWLILQGRLQEALEVCKSAAECNKRTLPDDQVLLKMMNEIRQTELTRELMSVEDSEMSVRSCFRAFIKVHRLFTTPRMRRITLASFCNWFVVALVYYGITFDSAKLSSSRYLAIFLSGLVEFPAYLLSIPATNLLGRRYSVVLTHAVSAMAILLILSVPEHTAWPKLVLSMVGKFSATACFGILYLYSAEYFPTSVRTIGVGASSMSARIGSMTAPYVVDLLWQVHWSIPSVLFGSCALLAALVAFLLPETNKKRLPDTVQGVENGCWDTVPTREEDQL